MVSAPTAVELTAGDTKAEPTRPSSREIATYQKTVFASAPASIATLAAMMTSPIAMATGAGAKSENRPVSGSTSAANRLPGSSIEPATVGVKPCTIWPKIGKA